MCGGGGGGRGRERRHKLMDTALTVSKKTLRSV